MEFKMVVGTFGNLAIGEYFSAKEADVAIKIEPILSPYSDNRLFQRVVFNAIDIKNGTLLLIQDDQDVAALDVTITSKV